jgi:copper chaperone CopZ
MKKSSLIKTGKVALVFVSTLFVGIVIWANWEVKTYTQAHVADSQYITLKFAASSNAFNSSVLENKISAIDGVSSCSINSVEKIAGVIFYTSKLNTESLENKIKSETGYDVFEKTLAQQKNGCPVAGAKYLVYHIRDLFRFRS